MYVQTGFETFGGDAALVGGIVGMLAAALLFTVIVGIALYIYTAFAMMVIAQKLNYDKAWLAWIPIANYFLLPILAKKHWALGFLFFIPIVNLVMAIIWLWNIFEQRKYPGYLALIPIASVIPLIGILGSIGFLVVLGLVAWKDR